MGVRSRGYSIVSDSFWRNWQKVVTGRWQICAFKLYVLISSNKTLNFADDCRWRMIVAGCIHILSLESHCCCAVHIVEWHCYYHKYLTMLCTPAFMSWQKCNALLESPTGTGKTLCLLCATLAWRKSLGSFSTLGSQVNNQISGSQSSVNSSQSGDSKLPTILYTSRTHSQLRQVIQELKTSNYRLDIIPQVFA